MDKCSSEKKEHDFSLQALRVVQEATTEVKEPQVALELTPASKNPHAVALGRLGGKKGGKARAAKLTPEQRREIGRSDGR